MILQNREKYGYLRENADKAKQTQPNQNNGMHKTGLDEYLKVIFPDTTDWVHDAIIPNSGRKFRPDYRSDSLKLIIEFNGIDHYTNPARIMNVIGTMLFSCITSSIAFISSMWNKNKFYNIEKRIIELSELINQEK